MPNEMLNEKDIQNLFKDLLLQEDIDGERKLLQESGLNIDEKSLEEFHKKKEELFAFAKENKNELQKLDVNDMESVSGGLSPQVNNLLSAIIRWFWVGYVKGGSGLEAGFDAFMISSLTTIAGNVISTVASRWNTGVQTEKK